MARRLKISLSFLPVILLACASDPSADPSDAISEVRSELSRDLEPSVPLEDSAALARDNLAFATDLYGELRAEAGILFLSPHSISTALAMTYAGAEGTTAEEMATVLHYSLPEARLHPAMNQLALELERRADGGAFQLSIANALFGREGLGFEAEFLDLLAVNYGAGISMLDFGDEPTARAAINAWVSEQTNERIPKLIGEGVLTGDTALVLTNAVYFNADWAQPFEREATWDVPFSRLDGTEVTVPMMHQDAIFAYAAGEGWAALSMPYQGGALAMTVVLPDLGAFGTIEQGFTAEFAAQVLAATQDSYVAVALPKFTFEAGFELSGKLAELGMPTAFGGEADFSGMTTETSLAISQVIHKAFVAVDEKGTEAAAATAVVMTDSAAPAQPELRFEADRPFLFFIHDRPTGAVLFLGRLVEPG